MGRGRVNCENPSVLFHIVAFAVVAALATSSSGWAVEIQPGQVYAGGTRLEATELGVAFTVPSGWRGTLPAGSEVFVLQPDTDPQVHILAMGDRATRDELASIMAAPIDLGDGLFLDPTGAVVDRGEVLSGRYEVRGSPTRLLAYSEALAGPGGLSVGYLLIAAPASLAGYEPAVQALIASTELGAPAAPVPATPSAGGNASGGAASGTGDRWDAYLEGKYILRYHTATGFTDEQHLWLCSDGTFQRRGASGGFGGGASGAFQNNSTGSWSATGAGEYGSLTLRHGDGTTSQYELRWDYQENKLYVDGKRWLHGENEVCN